MCCKEKLESAGSRAHGGVAVRAGGAGALASLLLSVCVPWAHAATADIPDGDFLRWTGSVETRPLQDDTILSEYVAQTEGTDPADVSLSLRFVPRFACSPLIGFTITGDTMRTTLAELQDGVTATFSIDGAAQSLSLFVDVEQDALSLWTDDLIDSREELRKLLDSGSRAVLTLPNERSFYFSLLGSRQSTAAAESACRNHEPLPKP